MNLLSKLLRKIFSTNTKEISRYSDRSQFSETKQDITEMKHYPSINLHLVEYRLLMEISLIINKLYDEHLVSSFLEAFFEFLQKKNTISNCNEYLAKATKIYRKVNTDIYPFDYIIYFYIIDYIERRTYLYNKNLQDVLTINKEFKHSRDYLTDGNLITILSVLSEITKDKALFVQLLACLLARSIAITKRIQSNALIREAIEETLLENSVYLEEDEIEFLIDLINKELEVQIYSHEEMRLIILIYSIFKKYNSIKSLLPNFPTISPDNPINLQLLISSKFIVETIESIAFKNDIDINTPTYLRNFPNYLTNTYFYDAIIYRFLESLEFSFSKETIEKYHQFTENLSKNLNHELRKLLFQLRKRKNSANNSSQNFNLSHVNSGQEFEHFCAQLFKQLGFEVKITPASKDQGADLILLNPQTREKFVVQCKYYTNPVGNKAIQEAIAARTYYNTDKSIVLTNSTFTRPAIELAKKANVILIDKAKLRKLIKLTTNKNEKEKVASILFQ